MIVVNIEMWPGGSEEGKYHLGTAVIYNEASETSKTDGKRGSYYAILGKKGEADVGRLRANKGRWRTGSIRGFPRKRLGPWDLLYRVLKETVAYRNE